MHKSPVYVLALVAVLLLAGQIVAYYAPSDGCSISTDVDGSKISYDIDPPMPTQCSVMHLTGTAEITTFYALVDDSYASGMDSSSIPATYYFMEREADRCPSMTLEARNASEIRELFDSGSHDFGLIFFTGTIPDVLYDGTVSSPLIQWIQSGGYVIWSGDVFGRTVSTAEGLREIDDYGTNISVPLFGAEDVFNTSAETVYCDQRINPDLTGPTCMYFANITDAVKPSAISAPCMTLGYTDGEYSSIAVVGVGSGTLCLFGDYAMHQESRYLVHAAFLGLTAYSEVAYQNTADIPSKGTSGSFTDSADQRHVIILHDVNWSRAWTYDRAEEKFV